MIRILHKDTLISKWVDETNPKKYPTADYNANWLVIPTALEDCKYLKVENDVVVEDTAAETTASIATLNKEWAETQDSYTKSISQKTNLGQTTQASDLKTELATAQDTFFTALIALYT